MRYKVSYSTSPTPNPPPYRCALCDVCGGGHATRSNDGGLLVEVMLYMLEGVNGTRRVSAVNGVLEVMRCMLLGTPEAVEVHAMCWSCRSSYPLWWR
jgi:hypothetical protein